MTEPQNKQTVVGDYKEQLPLEGVWRPQEDGEQIEGVIIEKRDGSFGVEFVMLTDLAIKYTTPSHKLLQDRMHNVIEGDRVRITYKGTVETQHKPAYVYKVEKKE